MIKKIKSNKQIRKIIVFVLFIIGKIMELFIKKKDKKIKPNEIKNIFINANFSAIGNFLLFTPLIRNLKENLPNSHITLMIVKNPNYQFIKNTKYCDTIIEFPTKFLGLMKLGLSLRKKHFDLGISNYYNGTSRKIPLFFLLMGIPYRITHIDPLMPTKLFYNKSFSCFFTHKIPLQDKHEIDINLDIIRLLGIKPNRDKFILNIPEKDEQFAEQFFKEHNINEKNLVIGFHAGSNDKQTWKRWSKFKFAKLANLLKKKYNSINILFGGPNEIELNNEIFDLMGKEGINLAGKITLTQVAAIIKRCTLLVANDSGLMHIASIMKVPSFVIIGPTDYIRSGPFFEKSQIIRIDLPCSRCYRLDSYNPEKCNFGLKCLKLIEPEMVLNKIDEFLSKN
ncbi:MAG: glycosyltransferase family 9 protein [Candidatus Helarchaeota archaeon]